MTLKEILRADRRKIDHSETSSENAEAFFTHLMPLIQWELKPIIAGYWPIEGEVDGRAFLKHCHIQGLQCGLPFITDPNSPLTFKTWQPTDMLEKGMYGILTPSAEAATLIPDVLLVPLLAFDKDCHRLGKGGGFYDRTLEVLRQRHTILAIGLAYDYQEIEHVPREPHDQPLDYIITPSRVIFACHPHKVGEPVF